MARRAGTCFAALSRVCPLEIALKPKTQSPTRPRQDARDRTEFQEVHVNTLRLDSPLPFRLFTRIEGEYLLYRREDLPFTLTQRNALLENRIEVLFVSGDEVDLYWNYLRGGIAGILDRKDIPLGEQSNLFYESTSELTRQILSGPICTDSVSTARVLVSEAVRFQHSGKNALHALMSDMKTHPSIYHHSLNVCQYGLALARVVGFSQQDLEAFGLGLLFQDVGMLLIPDGIVYKDGPLSFEEWNSLKRHPQMSLEQLEQVEGVSDLSREVVLGHHERLDGSGYPRGLREDEIPALVRIASIVDVFTSLTTSRPFRSANTTFEALRIMSQDLKGQLDASLFQVFIRILGT
ncbi:MAG: HD domain-containing protein [Planctomycetes bacterium]|nr:HD domain-containing protein [Planctomycetota bacterium]